MMLKASNNCIKSYTNYSIYLGCPVQGSKLLRPSSKALKRCLLCSLAEIAMQCHLQQTQNSSHANERTHNPNTLCRNRRTYKHSLRSARAGARDIASRTHHHRDRRDIAHHATGHWQHYDCGSCTCACNCASYSCWCSGPNYWICE